MRNENAKFTGIHFLYDDRLAISTIARWSRALSNRLLMQLLVRTR